MKNKILLLTAFLTLTALFQPSYALAEEKTAVITQNERSQYQPFSREVYYNNCVIVYPKEDRGGYIIASGIASEAMKNSKISIQILKDSEATKESLQSKNVILIGNISNNSFIKELESKLPVKLTADSLRVGTKSYDKDYGVSFIYPNLYNPANKMIFIMANNENALKMPDFKGYDLAVTKGINEILPFQFKEVANGKYDEKWNLKEVEEISAKLLQTGENEKVKVGEIKQYPFPEWAKGKVMYEIFVRSFCDSNGDRIGDLNGITSKLDYIKSLGVDMIWLTPIFESPSTHGYDTKDYFAINKSYGTMEDYRNLVKTAHSKNIKIILDVAFNHLSRFEPHFVDAYGNQDSKYDRWFYFSNLKNTIYHDYYFKFNDASRDTVDSRLPAWNTNNPEVIDYHTSVLKFWLDPNQDGDSSDGADGYRFDVAKGPSHEYWKVIRQRLKAMNPDILMVGEVWAERSEQMNFFDNEMDTIFDFALQGALTTGLPKDIFSNFEIEEYSTPENGIYTRFISNHDMDRMPSFMPNEKIKLMSTLIFTLKGIPMIYYGDEIGQKGGAEDGNDEGRRRPMEWYKEKKGEGMTRWTSLGNKTPDGISVEEQNGVKGSLLEHFRKLGKIRAEYRDIFADGKVELINISDENGIKTRKVVAYKITGNGKHIIVLLNYGKEAGYKFEAGEELKGKEFKEVLNNKEDIKVEGKTGVTMGTQEARVYVEK